MPSNVAVKVKNCAIARQVLAAMSFSSLRMIEVKARATATRNEAVAIAFSSVRFEAFFIFASSYILTFCKILMELAINSRGQARCACKGNKRHDYNCQQTTDGWNYCR